MEHVIRVERDGEGLQMALLWLLEEALVRGRIAKAVASASDYEVTRLEAEIPDREISPGYFTRAGYLLGLSTDLELGIPIDPASISPSDVIGIRAVRAARAEFDREHPGCPRCGERQDNNVMRVCWACNYKLRGEA